MSNYTKTTDFQAKDSLPAGDSNKVIRGSEFETEFDNIATAVNSKADTANATLTGTTTFETISDGVINVTAFVDEDNMASNSATLVPTQQSVKAYVDSQITANNELSEVLSNGNTTGGSNISFGDNDKAVFGAESDLQIYHDGSHSYIEDAAGTGNLKLRTNTLRIENAAGTELSALFVQDGAATLYNDNTARLATTSSGIDVTGTVTADALTVEPASGNGLLEVTGGGDNSFAYMRLTGKLGGTESYSQIYSNYTGSLIFQHDNGNNLAQFASNGDISFYNSAGTSQSFFWDASAERLGLGTTSPSYTLDLQNSAGGSLARFKDSDSSHKGIVIAGDTNSGWVGNDLLTTGEGIYYQNSLNAMRMYTNGSERVRIDSSGRLGIGTSSPSSKLQVMGGTSGLDQISLSSNLTNNNIKYAGIVMTNYGNTTTALLGGKAQNGTTSVYYGSSGSDHRGPQNHIFYTNASATATSGNTERMRIDSNGRLGLGTASPDTLLEVVGADPILTIRDTETGTSATNATLRLAESGGGDALGNYWDINYTTNNALRVSSSFGSEVMRIDSSGNVGIGTTSPSGLLHVASTGAANIKIEDTDNGFAATELNVENGGRDFKITTPQDTIFVQGSTEAMRLDASGNLLVGTTDSSPVGNNSDSGIALRSNGSLQLSRHEGTSLLLNRRNNDGEIIRFHKNAVIVGSIGTVGSDIYVGTGDTNVRFDDGADQIYPVNSDGSHRDGAVGLGWSGGRFKDLYLSGNAYVSDGTNGRIQLGGSTNLQIRGGSAFGGIRYHTNNGHAWYKDSSELMKLDTNGNLLVGTSIADAEGITLRGDSAYFKVVRNGGITAYFDRKSSDGDIVQFRKDGPSGVVGSIGVDNNDNLTIEGNASHGGLQIATNVILPHKNGALADDTIGLGNGDNRFTELFLSGGAYLGGTAAANKLDDYEEGTWTPTVYAATTGTNRATSIANATYTKIGRLVRCKAYLSVVDGTALNGDSGAIQLGGLPFSASSYGHLRTLYSNLSSSSITGIVTGTVVGLRVGDSQTTLQPSNINTGTNNIMIDVTFEV